MITYWEMAAAMVLHGAVSAELFVDCNAEGFFLLAKFAHILESIRERIPGFMNKTSELVNRISLPPPVSRLCSRTSKPAAKRCSELKSHFPFLCGMNASQIAACPMHIRWSIMVSGSS